MNKQLKMTWNQLALIMMAAVLLLSGCASGNGEQPQASTQPSGTETGAPAGEEAKPTLKFLGINGNFDPNKEKIVEDIEKLTGYQVEYYMLPSDKADEKLNIEVGSGTDKDIIVMNPTQYAQLSTQGALADLEELVEQFGPNIKKAIKPESLELTTLDGKLFGIPYTQQNLNIRTGFEIRADLLAELGMEMPEGPDELYELLKAVQAKYPDMIPLTAGATWKFNTLMSAFGLYNDWNDVDGKLVPLIKSPGVKEYVAFLVKLYGEGLLDPDYAVNTGKTTQEKFSSGKAFALHSDWNVHPVVYPALLKAVPGAKVDFIDPLKDASGKAGAGVIGDIQYIIAVPKASKNAEHAIKFIDKQLQRDNPDIFTQLTLGVENVSYKQENGEYYPIEPAFSEKYSNAWWYMTGFDEAAYPNMWLARLRRNPDTIEAYQMVNRKFDEVAVPDPLGYMPPTAAVLKNKQALMKLENDFFIKVLLGNKTVDDLDAFIADWEAAGGKEMETVINEWYADSSNK